MRRWKSSEYKELVGQTAWPAVPPVRVFRPKEKGTLLVDRALLEFALRTGKQKQLATYCRLRHGAYANAGFVTQDMLKSTTMRLHLRWMLSQGWVRKIKTGLYQLVSMKTIARKLGSYRTAVALSLEDWDKDPLALCYGAWIACYARTWKNRYHGAAISDGLKRTHFVIASAGMIAKILGVSERVVHKWKERAWELYWQKESVKSVLPPREHSALAVAGYNVPAYRRRGGWRVLLGPNVYYNFQLHATKRVRW